MLTIAESHGEVPLKFGTSSGVPCTGDCLSNERTLERALARKLDLRLLPVVIIAFVVTNVDRIAINISRDQGLQQDLHLTDTQYNIVLATIYASFCLAQAPCYLILDRLTLKSHYLTGACLLAWGLAVAAGGVTRNLSGILACRVLVGVAEAAFYTSALYTLSRSYTGPELSLRSTSLYASFLASNAFGSLIVDGILLGTEGKAGVRAWRWLFCIEGATVAFFGLISMWLLRDLPLRVLHAETVDPQSHLAGGARANRGDLEESAWAGFANSFPSLVSALGFATTTSLLLSVPPWFVAAAVCCVNVLYAEKTWEHLVHVASWWCIIIVSFAIGGSAEGVAVEYMSVFLITCGYAGLALSLVSISPVFSGPPAKRAATLAIISSSGNLGNLLGSFIWNTRQAPEYRMSSCIGLGAMGLSTILAFVLRVMHARKSELAEVLPKAASEQSNKRTLPTGGHSSSETCIMPIVEKPGLSVP
ncbi:major facilitator superfamily domain-containing protein [Gloeopeniophorella convolvens]|nr:major facilitator superfamily domain-containing protein [Gloeopeniophorella convolvens]